MVQECHDLLGVIVRRFVPKLNCSLVNKVVIVTLKVVDFVSIDDFFQFFVDFDL